MINDSVLNMMVLCLAGFPLELVTNADEGLALYRHLKSVIL